MFDPFYLFSGLFLGLLLGGFRICQKYGDSTQNILAFIRLTQRTICTKILNRQLYSLRPARGRKKQLNNHTTRTLKLHSRISKKKKKTEAKKKKKEGKRREKR